MRAIVDTCVWSQFFRRQGSSSDAVVVELARLVRSEAVQLIGPIRQELLSGAQPSERFEQLRQYLRYFPNLLLDEEDDELAANYYNRLRLRGLQSSGTDLLICAVAVRHNLKIFTVDRDFTEYAKHIPVKLHCVRGI